MKNEPGNKDQEKKHKNNQNDQEAKNTNSPDTNDIVRPKPKKGKPVYRSVDLDDIKRKEDDN